MCDEVDQRDRTWQHWRQVREKLAEVLDCICILGQGSACRSDWLAGWEDYYADQIRKFL